MNVQAYLRMHVLELSDYEVDAKPRLAGPRRRLAGGAGRLQRSAAADLVWGHRLLARPLHRRLRHSPRGRQEACAEWVALLFWQTKRDPAWQASRSPAPLSRVPVQGIPEHVQALLAPYRDYKLRVTGG